jgi:hypothetical protein
MYVKLTDSRDCTGVTRDHPTQWGEGIEHTAPGGEPCTADVLHCYDDALMAVLCDPIHGKYLPEGHARECEGDMPSTDGFKRWGTRLRTLCRIELPVVTLEQRIEWAIRCALAANHTWAGRQRWEQWAQAWLDGRNRAAYAAAGAANAAYAAYAAPAAAAYAAAYAADADADAAYAAADAAAAAAADAAAAAAAAAYAANAAYAAPAAAAYAAAYAANAAADAANAAYAAYAAAAAGVDVRAIAHQVCDA